MKLLRYGPKGQEKPGLIDAGGVMRDLSGVIDDIAGDVLGEAGLARLRALDPATLPRVPDGVRLGACVGRVGKMVCIGLNYADHAAESNLPVPTEPVVFNKRTSAIVGPNDDVEIPRGSTKTDWEVELGVVIGKTCKYVDAADALDYVAGYCVVNDISEREWQIERGGQWDNGKGFDTFGPLGPWLVTGIVLIVMLRRPSLDFDLALTFVGDQLDSIDNMLPALNRVPAGIAQEVLNLGLDLRLADLGPIPLNDEGSVIAGEVHREGVGESFAVVSHFWPST